MGFFPLGSFTGGLFSGAQNTVQLMGEVQKYNENAATFQDRAQAYKDAVAANKPTGSTQATQPSTALSTDSPKVQIATPPPDTPPDPNAPALTPAIPPGSSTPPPAAPTVVAPPAATPTPAPTPIVPQTSGSYDLPPSAPAPAAPATTAPAPAKQSALGGTAYSGQTQTADASAGKSYTSDAPLVYLPPGQFSAQTRGQATQAQAGQRAPPSQVTALSGANFPTVGRTA